MIPGARMRLLAAGAALLALSAAHSPGPTSWWDRQLFDLLAPRPRGPSRVEGIAITPEDVERLERFGVTPGTWPWRRIAHGAVVHALQKMGAAGIAFSLFFERPQEAASDQGLASEIHTAGIPVLLAGYLEALPDHDAARSPREPRLDLDLAAAQAAGLRLPDQGRLRPLLPSLVTEAVAVGVVNLPEGGLGASRGLPLVYRDGPHLLPSLALAAALAARPGGVRELRWRPGPTLVAGALAIPMTPAGRGLFRLTPVPHRSVTRLLDGFAAQLGRQEDVAGKLFFVGLEGTALGTLHEVPGGQSLAAYQLQAAAARAMLTGSLLSPLGRVGAGLLLLATLALAAGLTSHAPRRPLHAGLAALTASQLLVAAAAAAGCWTSGSGLGLATLVGAGVPALLEVAVLALARRDREEEMRRAEEVARELLPSALPAGIRGMLQPARVAAGDTYDGLEAGDGARMVLVADVSGKGLDGALLAGQVRATFRALASEGGDPAALLATLNRLLYPDLVRTGRLVTALVSRVSPQGHLQVAAAAHPPLLIVGPEGRVREVPARGKPLGYSPDSRYRLHEDVLAADEWGVLLSDGILEEPGPDGAVPGLAGIRRRLEGLTAPTATTLSEALLRGDDAPRDDQTLVLIQALREPGR